MKLNLNIKKIVIRFGIFFLLLVAIRFILNSFFSNTDLYQKLVIPDIYKPINSGMIALVGLIIFIGFLLINRDELKKIKVAKYRPLESLFFGILSILSVMFYYFVRYQIHNNIDIATTYIPLLILVLYLFIILFPLFLFLAVFGWEFIRSNFFRFKKQYPIFGIVAIIAYFLLIWIKSLWIYFSSGVANVLRFVFGLFFENVTLVMKPEGPLLKVNGFSAIIGAPCSGIDSFFLFSGLFIFIFILDYKKLDKKLMMLLFPIGVIGMYIVNIFRIFLLYLTGIYISPKFAVGLFHQNIGWIVFIVYFILFWWICSKFVYRKKSV